MNGIVSGKGADVVPKKHKWKVLSKKSIAMSKKWITIIFENELFVGAHLLTYIFQTAIDDLQMKYLNTVSKFNFNKLLVTGPLSKNLHSFHVDIKTPSPSEFKQFM